MVAWTSLFLPALLAAVLVFVASSIIHMVLQLHASSYKKLGNEDEVRDALRKTSPAPGQYVLPHSELKDAASPEMVRKFEEGPVGVLYVRPSGPMKLGPFLGQWFVYLLVVGLMVGYLARATCPPGTAYLQVFQLIGAASWLAYSWASVADSIWMGKPWGVTCADMRDGLIYALLTAGSFAWMWPEA